MVIVIFCFFLALFCAWRARKAQKFWQQHEQATAVEVDQYAHKSASVRKKLRTQPTLKPPTWWQHHRLNILIVLTISFAGLTVLSGALTWSLHHQRAQVSGLKEDIAKKCNPVAEELFAQQTAKLQDRDVQQYQKRHDEILKSGLCTLPSLNK